MAVCLWCEAEIQLVTAACPRCGKLQADHPSMPSLDLPAGRVRADTAAMARLEPVSLPPPLLVPGGGGSMFDADSFADVGEGPGFSDWKPPPKLNTDSSPPPSLSTVEMPPSAPPQPIKAARPAVDGAAARSLAAFGDAPKQWWQGPGYVYRVKTRQMVLGKLLAEKRALGLKAKTAHEDALVAFGEAVRPIAAKASGYAEGLSALAAAEELLRKQDSALAAAVTAHNAQVATFNGKIAALEGEHATAKAASDRVDAELATVESARERAEAKAKRVEIEARNARGGAAPSDPRRGAAEEEVARAAAAGAEVAGRAAAARRTTGAALQRVRDAKNELAALQAQFKRQTSAQEAGANPTRTAYRRAVAELAERAWLDTQTFGTEFKSAREEITRLGGAASSAADDVTLHEAALVAFDPQALKLGAAVLVGGAVALLILFAVLLRAVSGGAAAPPPGVEAPPAASN